MMHRCGRKSIVEHGIEKPKRLVEVLMEVGEKVGRYRNGTGGDLVKPKRIGGG